MPAYCRFDKIRLVVQASKELAKPLKNIFPNMRKITLQEVILHFLALPDYPLSVARHLVHDHDADNEHLSFWAC